MCQWSRCFAGTRTTLQGGVMDAARCRRAGLLASMPYSH